MDFELLCKYCNHKWNFTPNFYEKVEDLRCPVCKDKDLIAEEVDKSKTDIFGYNKK